MTTHVDVRCPQCRKRVRLSPDIVGKKIGCPHCKHIFRSETPDKQAQGALEQVGA